MIYAGRTPLGNGAATDEATIKIYEKKNNGRTDHHKHKKTQPGAYLTKQDG